jgi:hypothetical protein
MNIIEHIVLFILQNYKEKANRDRYILPIDKDISYFTNINKIISRKKKFSEKVDIHFFTFIKII